ncbi:MAG: alpha-isopropylmalate synthase regulatory domain-containing protein [Candidatus Azobacteroides pseudotrichonymphae]|uniref:D-citramalate synthase n=1 Tax=Azobacteroides pseudotrichonymphae genomovar. CFP2 TaxID=511995 RepID=B6YRN3_AZOPC|nr:D-citramalate synthase [Candidatus Azobacteroides pseudotrichonymphae genomovar. CFP2]GMO36523.1 MAG: alpha-isopropylmalate synthase regulatory domain-containing protein [Candidatus Azobacteroides pseudotrichonymphae]
MNIEILDTTLRDGEQTSGVSFASSEKLHIARILLVDLNIDRIEIASAKVSEGEYETVKRIVRWAIANNYIDRIEVLGFVDNTISLNWVKSTGCKVMNLLCKGSLKHCTKQLRKTPEQHLVDIKEVLRNAKKMDIIINIYLEDWSNGMTDNPDYVFFLMDNLKDTNIQHFMLPDTLGILNPFNTNIFCKRIRERYPNIQLDFHAHNDYDLAVGNVFAAVNAGITGIHTTINGLGERAGNAPLASVIATLHDQLKIKTNIVEEHLNWASRTIESYSGVRIPNNKPVIGDNVFTQCAGIHADGDSKSNLYCNDLLPERFGRLREYALGKTSGRSNIKKNLEEAGIELDEESMKKLTERIVRLGDKKEIVTQDDLPYIVSDILHSGNAEKIRIINYSLSLAHGLRPVATVRIEINGQEYEQTAVGDGQYHAFSRALWKIYTQLNKSTPILKDYNVSIPPGGRTDALVQTTIAWSFNSKDFKTRGLDVDQTKAAIKATVRMLNRIENM